MKRVAVLQHSEAEYLGLIEDHLEGRNIRFTYIRPFAAGGTVPEFTGGADGLILLGGGPYGLVSGHILPSIGPELRLTRSYLAEGRPVVGFGLGAVILAVAAGGGAEEARLRFTVETAIPESGALGGVPFPLACYLRDSPVLPAGAEVLARSPGGTPLVFAIGRNVGFLGHPGMKRGMAEDLIMEYAETPDEPLESLEALGRAQVDVATALGPVMVDLVARCGWM